VSIQKFQRSELFLRVWRGMLQPTDPASTNQRSDIGKQSYKKTEGNNQQKPMSANS